MVWRSRHRRRSNDECYAYSPCGVSGNCIIAYTSVRDKRRNIFSGMALGHIWKTDSGDSGSGMRRNHIRYMACGLYQQKKRIWQALYTDHAAIVSIHYLYRYFFYSNISDPGRYIQRLVIKERTDIVKDHIFIMAY